MEPGLEILVLEECSAAGREASQFSRRQLQGTRKQALRKELEVVAAGRTTTGRWPNRANRVTTARCISHTELVEDGQNENQI